MKLTRDELRMIDATEGMFTLSEADAIFGIGMKAPPWSEFIEIGSWKGRSTTALALAAHHRASRLTAIDTFRGGIDLPEIYTRPEFDANLRKNGVAQVVQTMETSSEKAALDAPRNAFLVFIDGDHREESVTRDLALWAWRVIPEGYLALHDTERPEVRRPIRQFLKDNPWWKIVKTRDSLMILQRLNHTPMWDPWNAIQVSTLGNRLMRAGYLIRRLNIQRRMR